MSPSIPVTTPIANAIAEKKRVVAIDAPTVVERRTTAASVVGGFTTDYNWPHHLENFFGRFSRLVFVSGIMPKTVHYV